MKMSSQTAVDFSKFSHDEFNAVDWINDAYAQCDSSGSREQHSMMLLTKLQLFIQEVNRALDDASQSVVQIMPKTLREIEVIQQEAELLQSKMRGVRRDVEKIEEETSEATKALLQIDAAKTRMQQVERALKELDNWSQLQRDVETVFASGDADAIGQRLIAMKKCLEVLGPKAPKYKDRASLLTRLIDQFVGIASPSVVSALSSDATDAVNYYMRIYTDLDRVEELHASYRQCVKAEVARQWKTAVASAVSEDEDLTNTIETFFDNLISMWHAQVKFATRVFGRAAPELITVGVTQGLNSDDLMEPSLHSYITDKLDSCADEKHLTLLRLKNTTDTLARTLLQNAETITTQQELSPSCLVELTEAAYRHLIPFVGSFPKYVRSFLLSRLNSVTFDRDIKENITQMRRSVELTQSDLGDAILQCCEFTAGCGVADVVSMIVKGYFSNYIPKLIGLIDNIRTQTDFAESGRLEQAESNWKRFDFALEIVQACGRLLQTHESLEDDLHSAITRVRRRLEELGHDGGGRHVDSGEVYVRLVHQQASITRTLTPFLARVTDESVALLPDVRNKILKLNDLAHTLAVDVLVNPIGFALDALPGMTNLWEAELPGGSQVMDLPAFGFNPQEYVTNIGQYLMTFAHHMDPYLSSTDPALCVALKNTKLNFGAASPKTLNIASNEDAVRAWLQCACVAVMDRYLQAATSIKYATFTGAKQLSVDIGYICNVLEDINVDPTSELTSLRDLLSAKAGDEFVEVAGGVKSNELVALVQQMRKL